MSKEQWISKKTIAVWFSCGAASAVAAKLTIEKYGQTHIVRIVNNYILDEDPDAWSSIASSVSFIAFCFMCVCCHYCQSH